MTKKKEEAEMYRPELSPEDAATLERIRERRGFKSVPKLLRAMIKEEDVQPAQRRRRVRML